MRERERERGFEELEEAEREDRRWRERRECKRFRERESGKWDLWVRERERERGERGVWGKVRVKEERAENEGRREFLVSDIDVEGTRRISNFINGLFFFFSLFSFFTLMFKGYISLSQKSVYFIYFI